MFEGKVNDWQSELRAVMNDVKGHVKEIEAANLPSTNSAIYMNLTTLENSKFCVQLTASGFALVGRDYNQTTLKIDRHYETLYSLLNLISPLYSNSFAKILSDKLNALQGQQ